MSVVTVVVGFSELIMLLVLFKLLIVRVSLM